MLIDASLLDAHGTLTVSLRRTASGQQSTVRLSGGSGRLEAVHEAVTSEVAARLRSGSWSAIGKRNLIGYASGVWAAANALVYANKGDHHESSGNFAR